MIHRADRSYDIARWSGTLLAALVLTMFVAPLSARAQCVTTLADMGTGSLRACIATANGSSGQTITFSPSLIGGIITVATPLTITASMTISGPGPNLLTISGGNQTLIFNVQTGAAPVTISGVSLIDGNSTTYPGAIQSQTNLTVNNVTFSDNYPGAIYNNGFNLTVTNSTFFANSGPQGGGIFNNGGAVIVNNSTFFGNFASGSGGGAIFTALGMLTLNNSTISGNAASSAGGGIFNGSSIVTLNNSIVAGNTPGGDDCDGCGVQSANNLIGGPPQLQPLGWYGGDTQTMLPLPGSPAIGAGMPPAMNASNMDQRGFARPTTGTIDLGAVQTNYLIVTTTADVSDGVPGCNSTGTPPCSLRDALTVAAPGGTDIAFASRVIGVISLTSALPAIAGKLDLAGPGANWLTVSGGGSSAVGTIFTVNSSNAAISGIAIANANSGHFGLGGGIYNSGAATLTVSNSAVSGSSAGDGGGIANDGTLTVYNSTFSGNTAIYGGGIFNGATLVVNYSSFSGNPVTNGGGGIYNSGTSAVNNSTFSGNASLPNNGGGILNFQGTLTVNNSILTADSGGECSGAGCPSNGVNGNVVDALPEQPILSPPGWYGGPTQTMLPLPHSPGICAGSVLLNPAGVSTDQRGFPATNLASNCLDAGAVQTNYLIVTTNSDVVDMPSACDAAGDTPCSLRDALASSFAADIAFAPGVTGAINLSTVNTPLPAITGYLDLVGPGANWLTVSGGNSSSVGSIFTLNSANAAISGITIAYGGGSFGGGIYNTGTLTVSNSAVSLNRAGGLFNKGGMLVNNSTVSGNYAGSDGGGIDNDSGGRLILTNSTVSGNGAGFGGGLYNATTAIVANSTVSNNNGSTLGGGIYNNDTLTLTNSIVAGNTNGSLGSDDCDNCGTQSSFNLIGGAPQLAMLGSYGGPTQTMLPVPGSPAICAGSPALDGFLPADQRGFPRLNTSYPGFSATAPCLDLGADQTGYQLQFANPSYSGMPGVTVSTPAAPVVSLTENGQSIGGVPLTLNFKGAQPGFASGLGPETTMAGTGATFPALTVRPAGQYTLLSSLAITPAITISGTAGLSITNAPPPTISKSFMPMSILVGGTSTLSFSIQNPSAAHGQTGIFFRDNFPSGMQVAAAPNASNTCGGTFTATAGATFVHLNGGSLAPSGSCSLSVLVKATKAGMLNNVTLPISSNNGGTGAASNTATLTVNNPITLVQDASRDAGTTGSTSLMFPSSNTAGNFIAVVVRAGIANETITVRDSAHNMYLKAVQLAAGGSPGGENLSIFYAQNIAGGVNTVTVSQTTQGTLRIAILEYSGVATSNALDKTSSAQGKSAAPNAGGVTTTTNGDLLLAGILTVDPEIYTPGPGYTAEAVIPGAPNTKLLVEQRIQPAAGPAGGGATLGSSDPWAAVLAAFHPAANQCVHAPLNAAGANEVSNACVNGPVQ
jgi:CSLREA domain-containing protein